MSFFKCSIKARLFEKKSNILISIDIFEEKEEKIINKIEELNKANIKYPSVKLFLGEHKNLKIPN